MNGKIIKPLSANEIESRVDNYVDDKIGTTDISAIGSTVTAAISSLNDNKENKNSIAYTLIIDCGTVSSLPKEISNSNITADMVVLKAELGTPSAQISDWTVTTVAGKLTISGTISGSTTVKLYLIKGK